MALETPLYMCVGEEITNAVCDDVPIQYVRTEVEENMLVFDAVIKFSSLRSLTAPFLALGARCLVLRSGGDLLVGVRPGVAIFPSVSRPSCTRSGLLGRSGLVERSSVTYRERVERRLGLVS